MSSSIKCRDGVKPIARSAAGGPRVSREVLAALGQLLDLPHQMEKLTGEVAALHAEVRLLRSGDPDELLDAKAAAKLLGMTEAAVRRASERGSPGVPRPVYLGRRVRWRRCDLLSRSGDSNGDRS